MLFTLICTPMVLQATPEDESIPVTPFMALDENWAEEPVAAPAVQVPHIVRDGVIAPAARQSTGALSGRIVYMGAGHGWTANQDNSGTLNGVWYTQRGDNGEIVEDLQNQDQMTMYAHYCFNAGATVVPFRPIGNQTNEVILDNDDPEVSYTGTWNNSSSTVFYGDPGDTPYRWTPKSATESATARYTPNIPTEGFYPIYTWVRPGIDRVDDQLYRVVHTGGTTEIWINHRMVGHGWVYLGTHYLAAGTGAYVEISNQSTTSTSGADNVFADAIRFGNGMGDVNRGGGISGEPREDENSRQWAQAMIGQGSASTIYDRSTLDDAGDNVGTPPRMAAHMNRESEGAMTDRVYLGFHSNASPGSIGLHNGNNDPSSDTPNQFRWAELVGRECNDDLVAIGSPPLEGPWLEQGPNPADVTLDRSDIEFGEINNNSINSEFDATIIEVAGHVGGSDPVNLRNPNVRNWLARACLQATVRYFNEFGGGPLAFLPEPPTNVRAISSGSGGIAVSWDVPVVDGIGGDAATGYVVYRSSNGYGFGNPITVAGGGTTSTTISGLSLNEIVYLRVAATNAGGESLPSETVAARPLSLGPSPILIVNGFDRFGRSLNPRESAASGIGSAIAGGATYDRVKPRLSNSFDYVVQVAEAIRNYSSTLDSLPRSFDSCQNEAITGGQVTLGDYDTVIWILGEESTADSTFDGSEQTAVSNFISGGGDLFVSGAEIGWDLELSGNGVSFYQSTLRSDYVADNAGTYSITGGSGIFSGIGAFSFDDGSLFYDVDFPDTLTGINGSVVNLTYSGGAGAGLQWPAGTAPGTGRIVMLGFPFETITSASVRSAMMSDVLDFFGTSLPAELTVFRAE
jgi:Fibronectin type III domain